MDPGTHISRRRLRLELYAVLLLALGVLGPAVSWLTGAEPVVSRIGPLRGDLSLLLVLTPLVMDGPTWCPHEFAMPAAVKA